MTAAGRYAGLVGLAGLAGLDQPQVLTGLLQLPDGDERPTHSVLNHDGQPLQLCLTARATGTDARLIADPGADLVGSPQDRLRAARKAFEAAVAFTGGGWARARLDRLLDHVGPSDPDALAAYRHGVMWVAVGSTGVGLAVYVDMAPYGVEDGWDRVRAWLSAAGVAAEATAAVVDAGLAEAATVSSVGFEGTSADAFRLKVYWRMRSPTAVAAIPGPTPDARELARFLARVVRRQSVQLEGLVHSVGLSPGAGVVDSKLDVCACPRCVQHSSALWGVLLDLEARRLGLDGVGIGAALANPRVELALVGLGQRVDGRFRLNVYFKARANGPDSE